MGVFSVLVNIVLAYQLMCRVHVCRFVQPSRRVHTKLSLLDQDMPVPCAP